MEIDIQTGEGCRRTLVIELTAEEVNTTHEEVAQQYTRHARVPGFRPGKAPKAVVLKRFDKEIRKELQDRVLPDAYRKAMEEQQLKVAQVLGVDEFDLVAGQPLTLKIQLDVEPEIELPEYKGLKLDNERKEVADADVEETLDRLRGARAQYEEAEGEEATLAEGDLAQVDFEGTIDGQPIADLATEVATLGKGEDFWMQTGDDGFLPELAAGLIGAKNGEERTVEVHFPQEGSPEVVAGKTASYTATLKGIRRKILPELNDELAGQFGADSVDALKEEIRKDLENQAERAEQARRGDALIQQVLAATTFDVPASEVARETRGAVHEIVENNTRRGVDRDEIESNKEQIFESARQNAEERIRVQYLAKRIADAENIEITGQEVEEEINRLAMSYQMKPEEVRERMQEPEQQEQLLRSITVRKVIDFLVDAANVSD